MRELSCLWKPDGIKGVTMLDCKEIDYSQCSKGREKDILIQGELLGGGVTFIIGF